MMTTASISTAPTPEELERMFCALVDGTISAEEQGLVDHLIATDPAVRADYRDFMQTEYLLAWEIGYGVVGPAEDPTRPELADCVTENPVRMRFPWRRAGVWLLPLTLATALGATLVVATTAIVGSSPRLPAEPIAATLTDAEGARWGGTADHRVGAALVAGPLELMAGSAQITFGSGAVVAMQAPAEIEILGKNRMFLRSGRLTPFVPPAAKGFTVVSPTGEVVDFGTEFSIAVGPDGKTDVFVIDGEVKVKGGHGTVAEPVRLTQGFATRLAADQAAPRYTQRPLVIDHFTAEGGPLERVDVDPDQRTFVRDGGLWIPINGSPSRPQPLVRSVLANDFSAMVGRRSVISLKATLPNVQGASPSRWMALVVDDGSGEPPRAGDPRANFALIVSPHWQVGTRYNGKPGFLPRFFARDEDAVGPYQVVVTIDDSPAARETHGGTAVSVMVNGSEVVKNRRIEFNASPRLTFHTWEEERTGVVSYAVVDDFSVSVEAPAAPAPTIDCAS